MTEGVDLKGEASRFQIICKIPYPSLGDKIVRKRMNKWKWWYPLQTSKTVIQAIGRSVRSSEDYAVTYILDADWDRFYSRNQDMFPESFKESIVR
jgi:Rad3-related DNA helicase